MSFTNAQKNSAHVKAIHKKVFAELIMRAQWGAKHRNGYGDRSAYYPLKKTFLHHSVTAMIAASASVATESAAVRSIEQIGQNRFGVGMSYNVLSPSSGRLYQGTGFSRIAAHTGGFNTSGFALCFIGNYDTNELTDAQKRSAAELAIANWVEGIFEQPVWTNCHLDVFATSCPGNDACKARTEINAIAASLIRDGKAPSRTPAKKPAKKPAPAKVWPQVAQQNPFGLTNPFGKAGAAGRNPRDNWFEIVPEDVRDALSAALAGAGYKRSADTKWGLESQIATWMLNHGTHRWYTRDPQVQAVARASGRPGFGGPASIWAAFQLYLKSQGLYKGAIDGHPGNQTWHAIVRWLNRIRPAYNR